MPESPFQRAAAEGLTGGSGPPAAPASPLDGLHGRKHQKAKQRIKQRYAKAREDAQLAGVIPTVPDGALKDECVDPLQQGSQPMPGLISQAVRNGWAVPEEIKPDLVDELIRILDDPEIPSKTKVAAFNALRMADQAQYERDHPETKGTKVSVAVGVGVSVFDKAIEYEKDLRRRLAGEEGSPVQGDGDRQQVDTPPTNGTSD